MEDDWTAGDPLLNGGAGGKPKWKNKLAQGATLTKGGFNTLRMKVTEAADSLSENLFEKDATPTTQIVTKGSHKKYLFGIPLDLALKRFPGRQIPPFVEKICLYIEKALIKEEGIFRLSGSQTEIEANKTLLDQGIDVAFWEIGDHAVCDLLKVYFRTLPQTLLTEELYDCFIAKATIAVTQKLDVDLAGLLQTLPNNNRFLLKRLLLLLKRVTVYSEYNKMGISNLALIFGPNLLQAPEGSDGSALLKDMPLINQIASNLITNCEALFKDTHLQENYIGFIQANFDYDKKTEGELSFRKGDILWLMERHNSGWWKGEAKGVVGYVPDTFVVEYDFLKQGKPPRKTTTTTTTTTTPTTPTTTTTTSAPLSPVHQPSSTSTVSPPPSSSQSVRMRPSASSASGGGGGGLRKHAPSPLPATPTQPQQPNFSISQPTRVGVSASHRVARPSSPLDIERERKKERRKAGVRRAGDLHSAKPVNTVKGGPDVSLLEKMAIFEKGPEKGVTTPAKPPPKPKVVESTKTVTGPSRTVTDRMAVFEKA